MSEQAITSTEAANELRGWPIPVWSAKILNTNEREPELNLVECHDCGRSDIQHYMHMWPRLADRPAARPSVMVCTGCDKKRKSAGQENGFTPVLRLLEAHTAARAAEAAALKRAQAVEALVQSLGGNQSEAARRLGLHQSTVNKLIQKARTATPEGAPE